MVGDLLGNEFVSVVEQVGDFSTVNVKGRVRKNGGNVASYFCSPSGRVINAVVGPVEADKLLAEAQWAVDAYQPVFKSSLHFQTHRIGKLHSERHAAGGWAGTKEAKLRTYLQRHPMAYLDHIYRHVFAEILGEKLSTAGVTIAQADEKIESAKASGRPLLFVIHDDSKNAFEVKWSRMTQESRFFDRSLKKLLADFVVIGLREDQQAALSQRIHRPPYESPTGQWPLFVIADSGGKQIDAISGDWNSKSLANLLATNWIDAIGDTKLTERRVKIARHVHGRLGHVPHAKYDELTLRLQAEHTAGKKR